MAKTQNPIQSSASLETATPELDARGRPFNWELLDLGYRPAEDQFPKKYVPRTEAAETTYSILQAIESGYIPYEWPEGCVPRSKEGREAWEKFQKYKLATLEQVFATISDKAVSQKRWLIAFGAVAMLLLLVLMLQ